ADEVHVAVGKVDPYYHAWVSVIEDGQRYILETTLDRAFPGEPYQVLEADPYQPLFYFNDEQAFEAYPGAFDELQVALGDLPQEEIKLRLIREIYQVVSAGACLDCAQGFGDHGPKRKHELPEGQLLVAVACSDSVTSRHF
ncbi:unnamed protein product, partial [marine sediment metagenome]